MHLVQNSKCVNAQRVKMNSFLETFPSTTQLPFPCVHQFGGVCVSV